MGGVITKGPDIIEKGVEAALNETIHVVLSKGDVALGIERQFTSKQIQGMNNIMQMFRWQTKSTLFQNITKKIFREFLLHCQDYVTNPNRHDTSHPYKTFTMLTRENYYARTLPERTTDAHQIFISEEEKKELTAYWLKRWPTLQIKPDDDENLRKEKMKLINEIPYCVKAGEFFKRGDKMLEDSNTNFLLPCLGQWFVEQAFKSGTDTHARLQIDEMGKSEFSRHWGHNRVDLSNLYGDNEHITWALRTRKGGKMKTQQVKIGEYICDFPPKLTLKTEGIADDEVSQSDVRMFIPKDMSQEEAVKNLYALGHPRFNMHFGMVLISTFFLREHNRLTEIVARENPEWSDERIFQTCRMINIGICCKVVVEDYIQHISGYESKIYFAPEVVWDSPFQYANRAHYEFNMLYRWHSVVPETIKLGDKVYEYEKIQFRPQMVSELGCQKIVESLVSTPMGVIGLKNTPEFLKNLDITTLLHSRVLKTQSYNDYRYFFGLDRVKDFSQITKNVELQKSLQNWYGNVDNVDWFIGLFAEDHLGKAMVGDTMMSQIEVYAFAAIFSNPLFCKEHYNEATFTKEGFATIKTTRFSDFVNRNLHENGCKDWINKAKNPNYDPFKFSHVEKEFKKQKEQPYKNSDQNIKMRQAKIEAERKQWPIYKASLPIRLDDSHVNLKYIIEVALETHHQVLMKRQLYEIFKTLTVSMHTKTFISTISTQFEIIMSILGSSSPYISSKDAKQLIRAIDDCERLNARHDLIDFHYGSISKYFSGFKADHLKNCVWNKDETFGEIFLNGLDPTQLTVLKEYQLAGDFAKFIPTASKYFETRWQGKKFLDEVKAGNIYYIDNYQTMSLITTAPHNIARPRGLFYWDESALKLMPFGIQLNNRLQVTFKVSGLYGKGLPRMDLMSLTDPFLQIQCGKKKEQTSVKWNTQNPKWTETYEFTADPSDSLSLKLLDHDLFWNESMDSFTVRVADFESGKNDLVYKLSNGGSIHCQIDVVGNKKDVEDGVYIPTDPNWTIAKLYLGNSYVIHHEIVTHNLKCHSVMEAVSISMHHTLYKTHPIRKLLEPHLYYTDTVNTLARKTLMKDDGTGLVSVLFSCGVDGYKINDYWFKKFDLTQHSFPEDIKRRGVKIGAYHWAEDGKKVWDAIETYVQSILKYYYSKEEEFLKDQELQAFCTMLDEAKIVKKEPLGGLPGTVPVARKTGRSPQPGSNGGSPEPESRKRSLVDEKKQKRRSWGLFESVPESHMFESLREREEKKQIEEFPKGIHPYTLSDVCYFLTSLIFNATSQHTALHYSQLDMMSFAPLLPTIINAPPPPFGDKSFGMPRDGYILSGEQQYTLMKYLPTLGQSIMINATFEPVTHASDLVPLISNSYNKFDSEPCLGYFFDFQRSLQKISNDITKRKYYPYQSRISQSVNF